MGAAISVIIDLIATATELSTATGFTVEAVLSGEALAAIEAQVSTIATMEGLAAESALASMGITPEMYAMLSTVPPTVEGVVFGAAGTAHILQTVAGSASLTLGVISGFRDQQVSIVNRNMALIPWRPEEYWDVLFPGVNTIARGLDVAHGWAHSLFQSVSREIWRTLFEETRAALDYAVRDVTVRQTHRLMDGVARMLENTRWVVTNAIEQGGQIVSNAVQNTGQLVLTAPGEAYRGLRNYYAELPGVNPAQRQQMLRTIERQNAQQALRTEVGRDVQSVTPSPKSSGFTESGNVIQRYMPPGGAMQRTCPDWMLPLILGLYGDINPTWHSVIEEEYGPQKKRRRLQ